MCSKGSFLCIDIQQFGVTSDYLYVHVETENFEALISLLLSYIVWRQLMCCLQIYGDAIYIHWAGYIQRGIHYFQLQVCMIVEYPLGQLVQQCSIL